MYVRGEMFMNEDMIRLLAEQSIIDGKQKFTESDIRDMVGAPTREEEENELCMCGEPLDTCPDAYSHVTMGY